MAHVWPVPRIEYMPLTELEEDRAVALVYSSAAWDAVQDRFHLDVVWKAEPVEASEAHWQTIGEGLHGDVIYAVGGGLAADAAKYLAIQFDLPLICVPTAVSVDAFITWASGVRRDGCVYYVETKPPERLIVDFDVLAAAPPTIRAAGICDVLSIATGSWDWRFAETKGKNSAETQYAAYADHNAASILQGALECAEAAGRGDAAGLRRIIECLVLEVQLCNLIGHSRPEEGSEHFFAYSVENTMGKGLPHGDLVGPGILLMASLQGQDITPLRKALEACNIPLSSIPADVVEVTLRSLPHYVRQHNLPYGIAHELTEEHLRILPTL